MIQARTQNSENPQTFYRDTELRKFHRQSYKDSRLNRCCEHVIRNGEPVTLTAEQREQFILNICDIPDNPIRLSVFLGMAAYALTTWILPALIFTVAYSFNQINTQISHMLCAAGIIILLLVIGGFVGLCILIKRKNRQHADRFRSEACEKVRRGDFRSYAYHIEEIYRVMTYNEDVYGGYIFVWYRAGDIIFELPDTTFAYNLGKSQEIIYKEPQKTELNERNHPVGGYIIGMIIKLDGCERFYGI